MTSLPQFSSVPGAAVPGMARPALVDNEGAGQVFAYYGHLTLDYLDYVDTRTGHTLIAVPGGSYSMMPVNSRAGLTIPPPDHRWFGETPGFEAELKAPPVRDDSVWYPPPHLAHLPAAVLGLIAARELKKRHAAGVVV